MGLMKIHHLIPRSIPNDAAGYTVFHLGLASEAAASIPVTFLIPDSQIEEDFGDVEPNSLDLYMKYAGTN